MTPPAQDAPDTHEVVPASSQPVAQVDTGTGNSVSPGPGNNSLAYSDIPAITAAGDLAPNSDSSSANAPPRPPSPTVEDEIQPRDIDQASIGEGVPRREGQGALGSGAKNDA
jgi:hypothetical protein